MPVMLRPWGHMNFEVGDGGRGPTVLFVNSLGTDLRMWQGVIRELPNRCVGFDMRGHGLSATPASDWTVEDIAGDVVVLMDHLGISKAVIAGCSVGGMVAQALAMHHPARASALILSNTAAKVGTPDGWQARIAAIEAGGIASIADQILDRWFSKSFRDSADALPWSTMLRRTDPVGYVQTCRALSRADLRGGLPGLRLPVLLLAGSEDLSTPTARIAETAARILGAAMVELPGSGHIPAIDAPTTTAGIIAKFLESLP